MNTCCVKNYFNNKCKNKNVIYISNNYYCINHINLLYLKYIIIIQKYYRGSKTRRILKNIYIKLPNDLQYKIKNYINNYLYKYNYVKKLNKIINNHITILYFNSNYIISYNELYNIYYLSIKYFKIMEFNIQKYIYGISSILDKYLIALIFEDYIETVNIYEYQQNNRLYNIIDLKNISFKQLISMRNLIKKYCEKYYLKYNMYNLM